LQLDGASGDRSSLVQERDALAQEVEVLRDSMRDMEDRRKLQVPGWKGLGWPGGLGLLACRRMVLASNPGRR
jgi:hypothetical protein